MKIRGIGWITGILSVLLVLSCSAGRSVSRTDAGEGGAPGTHSTTGGETTDKVVADASVSGASADGRSMRDWSEDTRDYDSRSTGPSTSDGRRIGTESVSSDPSGLTGTTGSSSSGYWANRQVTSAQAGEHNDNEEFHYYIDFLNQYAGSLGMDAKQVIGGLGDRVAVAVFDKNGNPLFHAKVTLGGDTQTTYQDGEAFFYPQNLGVKQKATITYQGVTTNLTLPMNAYDRYEVKMNLVRQEVQQIPVDIVFVMDTTGSMGDEIDILRDTLYSIYMRIKQISAGGTLAIRFGMVLYRDKGDVYLTNVFDLTSDVDSFQDFLYKVNAGGGGDTPEDIVSGLKAASTLSWNDQAVKLAFLITDAPGHLSSYGKWVDLAGTFARRDIKIFAIGASGLDITGEGQLRMLSQYTKGSFIFLTYGETGNSSGAGTVEDPGRVSHHTGANYNSRNLDDIVVDNVKREIYYLAKPDVVAALNNAYDYHGSEDEVYRRVDNAIQQIVKQTQARLSTNSTVLVVPPYATADSLKPLAEHIGSVSEEILIKGKYLKVVDRSNMQTITEEMALKLSGMTATASLSDITSADVILSGKLYFIADSSVLMVRLIDANNSEVIAAAMVKI